MRTPTYMILLAAPLALAACDSAEDASEPAETMMADEMSNADSMPMSDDMPMMNNAEAGQSGSGEGSGRRTGAQACVGRLGHGVAPSRAKGGGKTRGDGASPESDI